MAARKPASKRKYGKKATSKISTVMHEYGQGKLKSGKSGKKVKSRKQAVAIAISEARERGYKVPKQKTSSKSSATKSRKKTTTRKTKSTSTARKRTTHKKTSL